MKIEPIYERIGVLIKERRNNLPITQERLAEKLGLSRASLANIETGRQRVLVHQLYAIANALQLKPTDLLPPVGGELDELEWAGLPLPSDLKPEQKRQIARMLQDTQLEATTARGGRHGIKSK